MTTTLVFTPETDCAGHPAISPYVERYWLPVLGPTCTLALRTIAREVHAIGSWSITQEELAVRLGVGGHRSTIQASFDRLAYFGILSLVTANRRPDNPTLNYAVAMLVPNVPATSWDRLTPALRAELADLARLVTA